MVPYLMKMGGIEIGPHKQRNLILPIALPIALRHHDYCQVTSKGVEYRRRQGIHESKRFKRMETYPTSIQENMTSPWYLIYRPVCIKNFTSTSQSIYVIETRAI